MKHLKEADITNRLITEEKTRISFKKINVEKKIPLRILVVYTTVKPSVWNKLRITKLFIWSSFNFKKFSRVKLAYLKWLNIFSLNKFKF